MSIDIERIRNDELAALDGLGSAAELEQWWRETLGRKGHVQMLTRRMGEIPKEERPVFGKQVNELKQTLKEAFDLKKAALEDAELEARIAGDAIDVTLPGRRPPRGGLHPSTRLMRQMYRIFGDMGFQIYRSPEVVTDEYNFELLNMPPEHPARDMQDTFYTTEDGIVLRTHTSPGQISAMREYCPEPVRIILPGMCYRAEQITARSEIQFNQIEGLAVGHGITFADLKGTLTEFRAAPLRRRAQDPLPCELLPLHRAVGGDGRELLPLRRRGLPALQVLRLARDPRLRHGAPRRAAQRRLRPGRGLGLRLRLRPRAHRDAALRHRRHPVLLVQRPPIPRAVLRRACESP